MENERNKLTKIKTTDGHKYTQITMQLFGSSQSVDLIDLNPITEKIIGCAYKVGNTLGVGFLEKVYENALAVELQNNGLHVRQQHAVKVYYEGVIVGEYIADLLVEEKILVEIKAVKVIDDVYIAQCINYLKATGLRLCILINFGTRRVGIRRLAN